MRKRINTLPSCPRSKEHFDIQKLPLIDRSMKLLQRHLEDLKGNGDWQPRSAITEQQLRIAVEFLICETDPEIRKVLADVAQNTNHASVRESIVGERK